jgi:hypothetical protein
MRQCGWDMTQVHKRALCVLACVSIAVFECKISDQRGFLCPSAPTNKRRSPLCSSRTAAVSRVARLGRRLE